VRLLKEMKNLGGILAMTLLARLHWRRGVSRIRWYTASGICISWQSDRSENNKILLIIAVIY
jgi:hypothetical protein